MTISENKTRAGLVIDWFHVFDGETGEGFEDDAPDSDFSGSWSDGVLEVVGSGRIMLTDFYHLNDREYAVGTLMWPDGMTSLVSLARP